jgi:hypothetical protein
MPPLLEKDNADGKVAQRFGLYLDAFHHTFALSREAPEPYEVDILRAEPRCPFPQVALGLRAPSSQRSSCPAGLRRLKDMPLFRSHELSTQSLMKLSIRALGVVLQAIQL